MKHSDCHPSGVFVVRKGGKTNRYYIGFDGRSVTNLRFARRFPHAVEAWKFLIQSNRFDPPAWRVVRLRLKRCCGGEA